MSYGVLVLVVVSVSVPVVLVVGAVVVVPSLKPHFLPLLLGFGFLWWCFFTEHGFWLCGTPPLSAELRTGNAAAIPRQVTKIASFRVLSFTSSLPPWLVGSSPV